MAAGNASLVLARVQAWNRANPHAQLDPNAVLRVASGEGLSGGIGDNGTSFGPFQLHQGGALPSGISNPQQWAWSPAGIDYALSRIASVAAGLSGDQAVTQIVYRFERPANPAAEVARDGGINTSAAGFQQPAGFTPTAAGAPTDMVAQALLQSGGLFPQARTIRAGFKNPVVKLNTQPPADLTHALTVAKRYLDQAKGSFSNAGFAQYIHQQRGTTIPGSGRAQYRVTKPSGSPRPGDLVFSRGGQHLGVMVDHQTYLGASHGGKQLNVSALASGPQGGLTIVRTVDGANPVS